MVRFSLNDTLASLAESMEALGAAGPETDSDRLKRLIDVANAKVTIAREMGNFMNIKMKAIRLADDIGAAKIMPAISGDSGDDTILVRPARVRRIEGD